MQKKAIKFLKLEYLRKKYGISTQKDMARLLGQCESSYNHKVTGVTPFSYEDMVTLHKELNKRAKKAGDKELTLDEIFLD
jgi:hypothetical protein